MTPVSDNDPPRLILGPQTTRPCLREALRHAGLHGPFVSVTAGWQEREAEVGALEEHLGEPVTDLRLYAHAEAVFGADPELHAACRERQAALRELQDLYRIRLDHAKAAFREVTAQDRGTPQARAAAADALEALRRLDREHLDAIGRLHEAFEVRWHPATRPALRRRVDLLRETLAPAGTILLAGGHVAVLLNRLRLLGATEWLRERPLAAWSAGAMALAERVVLFHDHPPQGKGNAEVFEAGLALVRGSVLLPHARQRLALDDRDRVALLARRFAPQACLPLDEGTWMLFRRGAVAAAGTARRFEADGTLVDWPAVA
jgi:Peptidase family S51